MSEAQVLGDKFNETLLVMDAVDELRRQEAYLQQHADAVTDTEAMKERLRNLYKQTGMEVSDAILNQAIQAKLEQRFTYKSPAKNLSSKIALAYINREKAVFPLMVGVVVLVGIIVLHYLLVTMPHDREISRMAQEVNTAHNNWEAAIAKRNESIASVRKSIDSLNNAPPVVATQVRARKENAQSSLSSAAEQLRVASLLSRPEKVNESTVESVYKQDMDTIAQFMGALQVADSKINDAEAYVNGGRQFVDVANKFAAVASTLDDPALTPTVAQQAKVVYKQGEANLQVGKLAEAEQSLAKVQKILSIQPALAEFESRIKAAVALVNANNPNANTTATINQLKSVAEHNVSLLNVQDAEAAIGNLEAKAQEAAEDLQLVIVQKGKSGVWRYPHSNPNAKNYYLIVNARNTAGDIIPVMVKNEEDGQVSVVNTFGVRVPQATFDRVKADKQDNGIIENNVVAKKARGSLTYVPVLDSGDGRITQW